jgi:hypothetical protein
MTPNKKLHKILDQIKNERRGGAPHADWVSRNKEVMMMQVRNTTDATASKTTKKPIGVMTRHLFAIFFPMEQMAMAGRAIGVFALAIGIVVSGGIGTAQLYGDAVPGDLAYGMKTAIERTQLALAPNDSYKMRLLTEFADRRVDEIARLAEGNDAQRKHIPGVLTSFEKNLVAMQSGLTALRDSDPASIVEVAKLVERKMVVYHNVLHKASLEVPTDIRVQLALTGNLVDDGMVSALAMIVDAHLAGDENASSTILVSKFESRIRQAEDALAASGDAAATPPTENKKKVQQAIADAKVLIKDEQYQAALTKIEEIAELTKGEQESGEAGEQGGTVTPDAPVTEAPAAPSESAEPPTPESPPAE